MTFVSQQRLTIRIAASPALAPSTATNLKAKKWRFSRRFHEIGGVVLAQGGSCSSHLDHYYHYSVAGRVYEKKAEVEPEAERRSANGSAPTRPPDQLSANAQRADCLERAG